MPARAAALSGRTTPEGKDTTISTTRTVQTAAEPDPRPMVQGADTLMAMRSSDRFDINDLLAEARAQLVRVSPHQAQALLRRGGVILDTRQDTDRWADGIVPGSIHAPRTVLEWVVDPASGNANTVAQSLDQPLVVMCNEGYSSSLAAHNLQRIGFRNATDMIGGFHCWRSTGLPIQYPGRQESSS